MHTGWVVAETRVWGSYLHTRLDSQDVPGFAGVCATGMRDRSIVKAQLVCTPAHFESFIFSTSIFQGEVNRPGFDAASFFVKDEAHVEALPGRAT